MENNALNNLIASQQAGHENEPRWMIGEQLKEIAERTPGAEELLLQDLAIPEMNLAAAEKHFAEYANKNHGKASCFCITPKKAEELLRKFYGLPDGGTPEAPQKAEPKPSFSLEDFL